MVCESLQGSAPGQYSLRSYIMASSGAAPGVKWAPIRGVVAAAVTFFGPDGGVDAHAIAALAGHLAACGAAGVFVNGTTGEGVSLTVPERIAAARAWVGAAAAASPPGGRKLLVIVNVGCVRL